MERMTIAIKIIDRQLDPHRLCPRPRNKLMLVPGLSFRGDKWYVLRFPERAVDHSVRNLIETV